MEPNISDAVRYPIGRFQPPGQIGNEQINDWIEALRAFPEQLKKRVLPLEDTQLDTPYRKDGWTVRQLVHHLSDSHHNSYVRFKWALTEDNPVIKVYDQEGWASLFDSRTAPIELSLAHLQAVHAKLVYLLQGLEPEQYKRPLRHPEASAPTSIEENIGRYAWHGAHHLAHIDNLIARQGW